MPGHNQRISYVIWDLDNCLADDRPRIPMIEWSKFPDESCWERYHAASDADSVGNVVAFSMHHGPRTWGRSDRCLPLFMTARPERFRAATEEWIFTRLGWGLHMGRDDPHSMMLMMRKDGDNRRSREIKRDMVVKFFEEHPYARVERAYDDQPATVAMYQKEFGLDAHVLAIHGLEAHAPAVDSACDADIDSLAQLRPEKAADHAELRRQTGAKADAASVLAEMSSLFRERNSVYKDNYKMVAPIVRALFPAGVPAALVADDRWHLFELAIVKLTRFAISELQHSDSARDAAVYLAMIDAINKERQ